jgi:uncharacterized Zn finger protein (UPF0148 family)
MESNDHCGTCDSPLPRGARFCATCGHEVGGGSVESERRQLSAKDARAVQGGKDAKEQLKEFRAHVPRYLQYWCAVREEYWSRNSQRGEPRYSDWLAANLIAEAELMLKLCNQVNKVPAELTRYGFAIQTTTEPSLDSAVSVSQEEPDWPGDLVTKLHDTIQLAKKLIQ